MFSIEGNFISIKRNCSFFYQVEAYTFQLFLCHTAQIDLCSVVDAENEQKLLLNMTDIKMLLQTLEKKYQLSLQPCFNEEAK